MRVDMLCLLDGIIGKENLTFSIPVYQRHYDWDVKNCRRLLADVQRVLDTGRKHFLGSIVLKEDENSAISSRSFTIIDGQQRLTTMQLMVRALYDSCLEYDAAEARDLRSKYLLDGKAGVRQKLKLKPVKTDMAQYEALMLGHTDSLDPATGICRNYRLFAEAFSQWIKDGVSPHSITEALGKLEVVALLLTDGVDDPQLIFESINSTGVPLSQSDLIRNFLLMGTPDQDGLYGQYWQPLERELRPTSDSSDLDLFFTQFIQFRTGAFINSRRLYEKFTDFYHEHYQDKESCLQELLRYARVFRRIVRPEGGEGEAARVYAALKRLRQTTCYPFLFHLDDDLRSGVINTSTFEATLRLILAYLVRRIICGVPSNSLRNLFLTLHQRVFRIERNKGKYLAAISKFLHTRLSRDKVPTDAEFLRCLQEIKLYRNGAVCSYLLESIENEGKERLEAIGMSVEHIMPQNPGGNWPHIRMEDHERYVHVLGNLSLTAYNQELSNRDFTSKKNCLKENSKAAGLMRTSSTARSGISPPLWNAGNVWRGWRHACSPLTIRWIPRSSSTRRTWWGWMTRKP